MRIESIYYELVADLSRILTGSLLTKEQISKITRSTAGKFFSDFFPKLDEEIKAESRVEEARRHVAKATEIILQIREELDSQTTQLDTLVKQIEEKKSVSDRYEKLASTNKEVFEAYRIELEQSLRSELTKRANEGKNLRRFTSIAFWVFNLFIGAAAGAYFNELLSFFRSFIGV